MHIYDYMILYACIETDTDKDIDTILCVQISMMITDVYIRPYIVPTPTCIYLSIYGWTYTCVYIYIHKCMAHICAIYFHICMYA